MLDPEEQALLSIVANALQESLLLVGYVERTAASSIDDLRRIQLDLSRGVRALTALRPKDA